MPEYRSLSIELRNSLYRIGLDPPCEAYRVMRLRTQNKLKVMRGALTG